MDLSVSWKDEIWFLRVRHHVPHELYEVYHTTTFGHRPYLVVYQQRYFTYTDCHVRKYEQNHILRGNAV